MIKEQLLLIEHAKTTEEEIDLVTGLNGYNLKTLEEILFYKTGYRDFETFQEDLESN